eukprot:CAMPEP_0176146796 /NCGR_PEP_ID=MMETSP0120_2-20121206/74814_1 /TAXON_ID=160619 /ORGANISM="Kryptoperidinium foliaceum, Strain CCMP 1326" /LENGTH=105 /DNA_ID=CAMNT_0017483361 /DNA_START=64 /DNA_END=378 /DNA_ORIENTATION=+
MSNNESWNWENPGEEVGEGDLLGDADEEEEEESSDSSASSDSSSTDTSTRERSTKSSTTGSVPLSMKDTTASASERSYQTGDVVVEEEVEYPEEEVTEPLKIILV